MIVQGVTLQGTTVVDQSYITSGLVYYVDIGKTASYSGSGTTANNISGSAIGASTIANGPTFTSAGASSYFTLDRKSTRLNSSH